VTTLNSAVDQAQALLGRHLAEAPGDIRAWRTIGYCHLNKQEPQRALDAAAEALKLAPEDYGALILRANALTLGLSGSWRAAEPVLREAVRVDPHHWYGYAMLASAVARMAVYHHAVENIGKEITREEREEVLGEAKALVAEALRLGPEEVFAHEVAQLIAEFCGDSALIDHLDHAILRIDPTHSQALARQTRKAAEAPGVAAGPAADIYATGLAAAPQSAEMQHGLDQATYRMLRGVRWLALLCVGFAGTGVDLFAVEGKVQRELPLPLGQRLWFLVVTIAIWLVGACCATGDGAPVCDSTSSR
jgi:tetratricopeptide (TPR) repeat protein